MAITTTAARANIALPMRSIAEFSRIRDNCGKQDEWEVSEKKLGNTWGEEEQYDRRSDMIDEHPGPN